VSRLGPKKSAPRFGGLMPEMNMRAIAIFALVLIVIFGLASWIIF
jgi:hypothetical protein